jgi:uncharacterized protein YhbP (UPF0306 family)
MASPDEHEKQQLLSFMNSCKALVLATVNGDSCPACAPVYYNPFSYKELDFVSKPDSQHISNLQHSLIVAGAIFQEGTQLSDITGLQIRGKIRELEGETLAEAQQRYMDRFSEVRSNGFLMQMFMSTPLFRMEVCWARHSEHVNGWIERKEWDLGTEPDCDPS